MHSGTIMRRPFYTRLQITTIALLTLLFAATPCNANCFFPDGSDATDMVECPDSKSCCGKNQACLSNGLCFGADIGVIYRGSCSDKSWPIAECPRACYTELPDTFANLFQCPGTGGDWTNMTCSPEGEAQTACESAKGYFTWVSRGFVTTGNNGASESTNQTNSSTTATTPSQTSCPVCSDAADQSSSGYHSVALGAGLGVGLGVPLLISSALLVYFMGIRRHNPQQVTNMVQPGHSPSQMHGGGNVAEMGSKYARTELEG